MQTSVHAVDAMLDNLFRSSQLNRDEFRNKTKQSVKKTFDLYIQPFVIPAEGEKMPSTNMRMIMSTPCELVGSLPRVNIGRLQYICLNVCKR